MMGIRVMLHPTTPFSLLNQGGEPRIHFHSFWGARQPTGMSDYPALKQSCVPEQRLSIMSVRFRVKVIS